MVNGREERKEGVLEGDGKEGGMVKKRKREENDEIEVKGWGRREKQST